MKKLIPALSASVFILSGCATAITMDKATNTQSTTEHDQIRYIAQITSERVPSLLLLGDKYSYRIIDGYGGHSLTALNTLASTLDPRHIKASPVKIQLSYHSERFKSVNNRASFVFEYNKHGTPLTDSETAILNKYCQKSSSGAYTNCELSFHATIHPKQTPTAQMTALQGHYPVQINGYKKSLGIHSVLVPLAVALDVVTLPVQALAFMGCGKDCFK